MAVKIRLARLGRKNAPIFRIVAIDERSKRDGQALEVLGTYDPRTGTFAQFHQDRMQAWIAQGAQPTDAVKKLEKQFRRSAEAVKAA